MKLEQLQEAIGKKAGDVILRGKKLSTYRKIEGDLDLSQKKLTSLIGCPKEVSGHFKCDYNNLETLEGCPEEVEVFYCTGNAIKNLHDIHKHLLSCKYISLLKNQSNHTFLDCSKLRI
jgi:hypothetical protein